jgi:hypothetical protein
MCEMKRCIADGDSRDAQPYDDQDPTPIRQDCLLFSWLLLKRTAKESGFARPAGDVSVDLAELLEKTGKGYPIPSMVAFMQRTAGLLTPTRSQCPHIHSRAGGVPRGAAAATAAYLEHVYALGPAC